MSGARSPHISLVVACDLDGCIGKAGGLPWGDPIKADMGRFRKLTMGHAVIMGSRTWVSIPGPLEGRVNMVLSRRGPAKVTERLWVENNLDAALRIAAEFRWSPSIIGGADVFAQSLPLASRVYLTLVHGRYEGDRHFPLDLLLSGSDGWRETKREDVPTDPRDWRASGPRLTFLDYERGKRGDT